MKKIIMAVVLLCAGLTAYAQTRPRLGILPFTGGSGRDGDTIANLFSGSQDLMNAFRIVPRTSSVESIMQEHAFQRSSGLTDSDTIADLGRQMNADYVVSGHIARLGTANLLLISIVDVNTMRQITGDYREYQNIEEIPALLPLMARNIISSVQDESAAPAATLAVLPLLINDPAVQQEEAELLAQILATEIANSGRYAVFPRTRTIESVMAETEFQNSGMTDRDSMAAIGKATNARYVLSGQITTLGRMNLFNIGILDIESAEQIAASSKQYQNLEDGIEIMGELSYGVTGVLAGRYRESQQAAEAERQRAEAERQRIETERRQAETERQRIEAERQAEQRRVEAERQAERQRDQQRERFSSGFHNYLWNDGKNLTGLSGNFGISLGGAHTGALFVNISAAVPVIAHIFVELGADFGFTNGEEFFIYSGTNKYYYSNSLLFNDVEASKYSSVYPYARINGFIPMDTIGGFYGGLGLGRAAEVYTFSGTQGAPGGEKKYRSSAFDIVLGGLVGSEHHLFRPGFTFKFMTPEKPDSYPYKDGDMDELPKTLFVFQFTLGYTYRFK
ncbi:MAG: hypothetical protein LBF95_04740 [Treponema sp.]|jgi:TolB-like protein|nr:hypothetical protein [Treponema sp.]